MVVLQLTGANDYLNTIIPYTDGNYYDARAILSIPQDKVIQIDGKLGMHPAMAPLKRFYDSGSMAIIHGIGYENSVRSHFRSMDIWHTCEPDLVGTEGWLGRALRDLDPTSENPVTGVNIGDALPRALAAPGIPVASVADVSNYGLLTSVEEQEQRSEMLQRFANMYSPAIGTGLVMEYLGQTGLSALKGADILKAAPGPVLFQRRVRLQWDSQELARRCHDSSGRSGNPRFLHSARGFRHPRKPTPDSRQALG